MVLHIICFALSILGIALSAVLTMIGLAVLIAIAFMAILFVNELTGKCEKDNKENKRNYRKIKLKEKTIMKKVITDAQFTKMLCEVLALENPEVVYKLLEKANVDFANTELGVMDVVKAIRNLK